MGGFFRIIEGLGSLARAIVFMLIWVLVDGIVIRALVTILKALGPLARALGDNPVAQFLSALPDSPMPLTSYVWSLVGVWVVLAVLAVALYRAVRWAANHPEQAGRALSALGAIPGMLGALSETRRQGQARRRIEDDLAGPAGRGRWIIHIGRWQIRIGR